MKLIDLCIVSGVIELLSGGRIGGSDDMLQIGGTDLTVIRDPASGRPYLPGSSVKGKMRSSLELELGKLSGNEPCRCGAADCPIGRVFGPHNNSSHSLGPTRIIVHDAALCEGTAFAIENKVESVNNRSVGTAMHPRTVERIAPGARFNFTVGLRVFDSDENFKYTDKDGNDVVGKNALLEVVYHGMDLLEALGIGAGTGKGYGQLRIVDDKASWGNLRRRRAVKVS